MKLSRPLYQLIVGFAEIEKWKENKETQGAKLPATRAPTPATSDGEAGLSVAAAGFITRT